ncbi:hypothetical protein HHK36_020667 [Tetracentron sinense]|uniref:adenylate dimethylallyltransferase (ADP/ATP-dependent) n=1 Tax=Tetracentron sinense TaxID=13715 RepID=A0A835DBU4_TETSI|nr:hypothetical protein HHK36_020667 [Tetracentron sinense]
MSACKQAQPCEFFTMRTNMDSFETRWRKEKVVIVMGATGTGKSRLSIDLATRFPAEIVNSDKMQVYKGIDIVTNKVTEEEKCGVLHHLLGVVDPDAEFTATDFRNLASLAVQSILGRGRVPIIVGGSNSYIQALVNDLEFMSKYECCFLWVDVALPVLHSFVSHRVDQMVELGLVDEVRGIFDPEADYSRGIRRAIGVPEMKQYLLAEASADEETRARLLEAAISDIKVNTCQLACCQLEKIHRLRTLWNLHRLDATDAFLKRSGGEADKAWEKLVAGPSTMIMGQFLYEEDGEATISSPTATPVMTAVIIGTVMTAGPMTFFTSC